MIEIDQAMLQKTDYNLQFPKELLNFNIKWFYDKEESSYENKFVQEEGKKYYHLSKNFLKADPRIKDPKSIQNQGLYNIYYLVKKHGKWGFPSFTASNNFTLNDNKKDFVKKNLMKKGSLHQFSSYPIQVMDKSIEDQEIKENPHFQRCQGRKIYFYEFHHKEGDIEFEGFEDYAWATKFELKNYISREDFDHFSFLDV